MNNVPFIDYLLPKKIETFTSEFNQKVEVVKFMGKYRLDMGNLTQSGEVIKEIWTAGIKQILPKSFHPKKVLILGLGAGSLAELVTKRLKGAQITGVEIDPVVIQVAKKYFYLDSISNLEVVNSDAIKFVEALPKSEKYDLIFMDCYIGDQVPSFLEAPDFLNSLYQHLSPDGFLLINRLFWGKYITLAESFVKTIGDCFGTYKIARTFSNLIIGILKH